MLPKEDRFSIHLRTTAPDGLYKCYFVGFVRDDMVQPNSIRCPWPTTLAGFDIPR